MDKKYKKIVSVDFDGVINPYTSGWKGPRTISDQPSYEAIEFLINLTDHEDISVNIFSSRNRYFGGIRAMKKYITYWIFHYSWTHVLIQQRIVEQNLFIPLNRNQILKYYSGPEWCDKCKSYSKKLFKKIKFPLFKPASHILIDDRAIQFTGKFPDYNFISEFKPYYK